MKISVYCIKPTKPISKIDIDIFPVRFETIQTLASPRQLERIMEMIKVSFGRTKEQRIVYEIKWLLRKIYVDFLEEQNVPVIAYHVIYESLDSYKIDLFDIAIKILAEFFGCQILASHLINL